MKAIPGASFKVGSPKRDVLRAAGWPYPTLSETGTLPGGITFAPGPNGTGTLSGTAQPGSGGTYNLTIQATNVFGTVSQPMVLTVIQPPAFLNAATATFVHGHANSFSVVTSPSYPSATLSESGTLPAGVQFTATGNGHGTLSGTPLAASKRPYRLVFTATYGTSLVRQTFLLSVQ